MNYKKMSEEKINPLILLGVGFLAYKVLVPSPTRRRRRKKKGKYTDAQKVAYYRNIANKNGSSPNVIIK